jgi:signal transduction histidine kinase
LVLRPVYALTAHAHAMKAGRVDAPPPSYFGTSEFSDLGQSVIDMGETLHNRASGLRAYADHVTHELKSPLTAITGAAELLQGDVSAADQAVLAGTIQDAATRMEHLLNDMRAHAAAGLERTGGVADLDEVAAMLSGIDVHVVQGGALPISADDLCAVLMQLTQNAAAHGASCVALRWADGVLQVTDDGDGVAAGNQQRLFDPFFTTTRSEGGTGMGLSIARALLGAHGGKITFVPTPEGARFDISF